MDESDSEYSPRKRGCFQINQVTADWIKVFPAQAGVFLNPVQQTSSTNGIPRASGGVSRGHHHGTGRGENSPRKRGCFFSSGAPASARAVFPAQAGVFRSPAPECSGRERIPRASGGVSP